MSIGACMRGPRTKNTYCVARPVMPSACMHSDIADLTLTMAVDHVGHVPQVVELDVQLPEGQVRLTQQDGLVHALRQSR